IIQPHVQPGDAGAGGAQPDRLAAKAPLQRRTDSLPQRVALRFGCLPDERREVSVCVGWPIGTGDDQHRVAAQVGELDDHRVLAKVLRERRWIRFARPYFRTLFTALLADAPFAAFRWETPALTAATADRPFEFVVLDSPELWASPGLLCRL